jgi:deoxyribonuclease-4
MPTAAVVSGKAYRSGMTLPQVWFGSYNYCLRIGIHTSISGSLEKAALKAAQLGANTFQIFSTSPRMWRPSLPDPADIKRLRAAREKYDLYPLAIHDNCLINMASCTEEIRTKSVAAFRAEMERALAIGAEYLVAHPGSCKGHTVELGIATFCASLGEAARGLKTRGLTMLIENTAGSGQALGGRLEELAVMKEYAAQFTDVEIAFCIDTCHLMAAGYEISTAQGLRQSVRALDEVLGLANVPVMHANDTKTPLGSHVDRHAHIGEGYIGKEGFRRILSHPKLRGKAFIAETPIDNEGDDLRNVQMLISLCPKSRTTTKNSS